MAQEFKTSFIPKKTLAKTQKKVSSPVSLVMVLSTIIFLGTIGAAGGLYAYKLLTIKNIESKSESLERAKRAFEPSLIITLQNLDTRLKTVQSLLDKHTVLTPIFALLSETTLTSVQFSTFGVVFSPNGVPSITLNGEAPDYGAVALQADEFSADPRIRGPVISNLEITAEKNIKFTFTASIDPAVVSYQKSFASLTESNI